MKRLMLCVLIICVVCGFAACEKIHLPLDRFNVEAGRAAFIQAEEGLLPTLAVKIEVPEETMPYSPHLDTGVLIVSADSDEVDEDFNPIPAYGIADLSGNLLAECIYDRVAVSGNFLMAELEGSAGTGESLSYDFYYKDGTKLFNTENVINGFAAISEDYFVLYTEEASEVFYKDGNAIFGTNRQLSSEYCYSVCGEYLFAHEPESAIFFIFRIFQGSPILVNSFVSGSTKLYSVGYLGNGNFIVAATDVEDGSDYDYWTYIDSSRYNYSQTVKIYNPNSGEKAFETDVIIAGVINKYTPSIIYTERKNYNLEEGYSALLTIKVNGEKQSTGSECYVVNGEGLTVLRMPEGLTPFMLTYKYDSGFAGNALSGYAAALFDLSGAALWTKNDVEYYAQSYGYGRYVLAKTVSGVLCYGMLDGNGNTIIDFNLDFLSGFSGEYAIAELDGSYYRVNRSGELSAVIDDIREDNLQLSFNCYVYTESGKIGLKNFCGDILVAADYDDVEYLGVTGGQIFAIFIKDGIKEAYRLI